jgi:hypothetical protein
MPERGGATDRSQFATPTSALPLSLEDGLSHVRALHFNHQIHNKILVSPAWALYVVGDEGKAKPYYGERETAGTGLTASKLLDENDTL